MWRPPRHGRSIPSQPAPFQGPTAQARDPHLAAASWRRHLPAQPRHIHLADIAWNIAPDRMEAELAVAHFVERVTLAPALVHHAMERRDQTGAVGAMLTMQERRAIAHR